MHDKGQAMVLGSFLGDSLALGAHWLYDPSVIQQKFGYVDSFVPPLPGSYHQRKNPGEFTHYGDQTLVLLRHLAEHKCFSLDHFSYQWRKFIKNYTGYMDHASLETMENISNNISPNKCGSSSRELGGAARLAPLIYWYSHNVDEMLEKAKKQTLMTHQGKNVEDATDFIVHTLFAILNGQTPREAMKETLANNSLDEKLAQLLQKALSSRAEDDLTTTKDFGQMCHLKAALPAAVHFVVAYEDNFSDALSHNVMAGGDSAARGLVIGMMLGAHLGIKGLNTKWLNELAAYKEIKQLLERKL